MLPEFTLIYTWFFLSKTKLIALSLIFKCSSQESKVCNEIIITKILYFLNTVSTVAWLCKSAIFCKGCGLGPMRTGEIIHITQWKRSEDSVLIKQTIQRSICHHLLLFPPFRSFEAVVRNICDFVPDLGIFFRHRGESCLAELLAQCTLKNWCSQYSC